MLLAVWQSVDISRLSSYSHGAFPLFQPEVMSLSLSAFRCSVQWLCSLSDLLYSRKIFCCFGGVALKRLGLRNCSCPCVLLVCHGISIRSWAAIRYLTCFRCCKRRLFSLCNAVTTVFHSSDVSRLSPNLNFPRKYFSAKFLVPAVHKP